MFLAQLPLLQLASTAQFQASCKNKKHHMSLQMTEQNLEQEAAARVGPWSHREVL